MTSSSTSTKGLLKQHSSLTDVGDGGLRKIKSESSNTSPAPPTQLQDLYEYAKQRGVRHVFDLLPAENDYVFDDVPDSKAIRRGERKYHPKRLLLGQRHNHTAWAYLRYATYVEVIFYMETTTSLQYATIEDMHKLPLREPFSIFTAPDLRPNAHIQLKALIKYVFLLKRLEDTVFARSGSNTHVMVIGALRRIRDFHNKTTGETFRPSVLCS